jgi:hypothetical protein
MGMNMILKQFSARTTLALLLGLFCLACTTHRSTDEVQTSNTHEISTPEDGTKLLDCSMQTQEAANTGRAFADQIFP